MRQRRFAGLDGLRALAVVAVVVFHADPALLPGGFLGVDLFFVISGYLITRLLLSELGHTGRIDLVRFYLRRVLRLMPALLLVLVAVTLAAMFVWRDELATLRGSVISSVGYAGNWWLIDVHQSYFVSSGRPPMLQHLWSLAIEEQFYLIWPVLLLLMTSRRRRYGWVAAAAAGLAVLSTAVMAGLSIRDGVPFAADSSRVYFGTDTHSMGLLLGAAMGAIAERLDFQPKRSWRVRPWVTDVVGALALAALIVVLLRVDEFSEGLYRGGFLGVSALAVLVVSTVTRPASLLGKALDWRPLRWIGDRSYSIYLWHWPIVVVTRPGVDLPANRLLVDALRVSIPLVLASLSYAYVERPMRQAGTAWLDARRNPRGTASVAAAGGTGQEPLPVRRRRRLVTPRLVGVSALALGLLALLASPTARPRPAAALNRTAAVQQITVQGLGATERAGARPLISAKPTGPIAAVKPSAKPSAKSALKPGAKPSVKPSVKPPPPPPSVEPAVSAFGDSVMLGAQPAIDATFPHSQVRAVEGQQPYVTLQQVRDLQAAHQLCAVVVIHTGNNGIIRSSDLSDTLSALADRRQVVLLTDRVPMDWQGPNNATIKRVAKSFKNAVVLDWFGRSNGNQGWFYEDGLHLRPPGAAQYANLLASVVKR
ncbi:acyltransferase family protein [Jatrophihabitans sp. DSM 45814]